MKKALFFVFILSPVFLFSQLTIKSLQSTHGRIGFYEFKPPGYRPDSSYKYPLIIFMHGVGERGNGTSDMWMVLNASFPKMLKEGATLTFDVHGRKHAFLVLMPQMSKEYVNWQNFYVEDMIRYAKANLPIDTNKIFLTGWSLGGGGAWKFPTASMDSARLIAGIIPVAPAPNYTNVCNLANGRVAVWAHQSKDDPSIPISLTMTAVKGTNKCNPEVPARMSYYKIGKHTLVSYIAYDTGNKYMYPNIFQWMIGISRAERKSTNKAPIPNAGKDTTVILPSVSATLNGSSSYDPNDVIVGYRWNRISGPASPDLLIDHADFPVATVTGLEPGEHRFRLTVADAFGVTRSAETSVSVTLPPKGQNALPYVNLGPDRRAYMSSKTLVGTVKDFDGHIIDCQWRQVSGPVVAGIKPEMNRAGISGMSALGTYKFVLEATDNATPAGVSFDTVSVVRQPFMTPVLAYWSLDSSSQNLYGKFVLFLVPLLLIVTIFTSLKRSKK